MAIVPSRKMTIILAACLLVFCGFGVPVVILNLDIQGPSDVAAITMGTVFTAIGIGVFGLGLWACVVNHLRGPYLVYSTERQTISLLREGMVVPVAEAVGWRLVSGNWIGPEGQQKRQDYPISELQLILKAPDGSMAYVVAGAKADSVTEEARDVATLTELPLEIVKQHQGISFERFVRPYWGDG